MTREEFISEMTKAKTFQGLGDRSDYWAGYQRGLRRQFHGESFGTAEEHKKWSLLWLADDPSRRELGLGYLAGLGFMQAEVTRG